MCSVSSEQSGQPLRGEADGTPDALDQDQPAAGPQQGEPVAQGRHRIGQQPHHMPGHDHIELLLADRWLGRVPEKDPGAGAGELGPRLLHHARRPVDGGDPVPLSGGEQREASGAAPQVEHLGALAGQPALQPLRPGMPDGRVEQPVVGLLVEGVGRGIPVDRRHESIVPSTTDNDGPHGRKGPASECRDTGAGSLVPLLRSASSFRFVPLLRCRTGRYV